MYLRNLFTIAALAALTSAAPSSPGHGIEKRQECPYADWYLCMGPRRSACLSSGLEICQETGCGGPCYECDKFCFDSAQAECAELGCVKPDSK